MIRFSFNPEIRLGDLLATVGVASGVAIAYANIKAELAVLKEAQATQVVTNGEMRKEIREISVDIRQDIRDLRSETARRARPM